MARYPVILGIPNFGPLGVIAVNNKAFNSSYDSSLLPPANLLTEEPNDAAAARVNTTDVWWTGWAIAHDPSPLQELIGIAMVNVNLSPDGLYRFRDGQIEPGSIHSNPSGVTGGVGATGNETNLSTDAWDTLGVVPGGGISFNAINSEITFKFDTDPFLSGGEGTYGTPLAEGAHKAQFEFAVGLGSALVGIDAAIYFECQLYDGATFIRSLGWRGVTESTQLLIFTFDPDERLTDFKNIRARVIIRGASAAASSQVRISGVKVYAHTEAAIATGTLDSGWLPSPTAGIRQDAGTPRPYVNLDYFPPEGTVWPLASGSGRSYIIFEIIDDQTTHDPPLSLYSSNRPLASNIITRPSGYVQAGTLVFGLGRFLEYGLAVPPSPVPVIEGESGNTRGGQSFGADMYRRRHMQWDFHTDRQEEQELFDTLEWARGTVGPVYVAAEPDVDPALRRSTSFYATLESIGERGELDQEYDPGSGQRYRKVYNWIEKL